MKFDNNYQMLNKVILNTIYIYIHQAQEDNMELPVILYRLKSALIVYRVNNGFTKEEVEWVKTHSAKDKKLEEITRRPVSFIVFCLELIRLLVERVDKDKRPNFNISDKKLRVGRAEFFRSMLKMKKEDPEQYKEKRHIIDESVETAQEMFDYYYQLFIEKGNEDGNR